MTIYSIDPPFETNAVARETTVAVTAYDTETRHFWFGMPGGWQCGTAIGGMFNPPPPIPVAARKPRVGEVWMFDDGPANPFPRLARLVVKDTGDTLFAIACDGYFKKWTRCQCIRPATLDEAEPFRELMEGLMRAFGENGHG